MHFPQEQEYRTGHRTAPTATATPKPMLSKTTQHYYSCHTLYPAHSWGLCAAQHVCMRTASNANSCCQPACVRTHHLHAHHAPQMLCLSCSPSICIRLPKAPCSYTGHHIMGSTACAFKRQLRQHRNGRASYAVHPCSHRLMAPTNHTGTPAFKGLSQSRSSYVISSGAQEILCK